MNSAINSFLVWWLRSGRYRWSKIRRWFFERRYLKKELPEANSLEDIRACLKRIKWTRDGPLHLFDCIGYPQTTWVKKKDDCDGFSVLAAELLNRWSLDANPVLITAVVRPIRKSHTVCAFMSQQGALCYFDNHKLRRNHYSKYEDIIEKTSRGRQLVCWDVRNPFTLEMVEFHRA